MGKREEITNIMEERKRDAHKTAAGCFRYITARLRLEAHSVLTGLTPEESSSSTSYN
jgi:hypothetical protein